MTLNDAQESLKINKYALDEELVQQPVLYSYVSEHVAQAHSRVDQCKRDREEIEHHLDQGIRSEAVRNSVKVTEKSIDAMIKSREDWLSAQHQVEIAEKEMRSWMGMQEAFRQRAFMLRDLVVLVSNEYTMTDSYSSAKAKLQTAKQGGK